MAEAVSRLAHNQEVGGSNPSPATQGRTGGFYSKFDGKSDIYENKTNEFLLNLLKFFKIFGGIAKTNTTNTIPILSTQRELVVFTVTGKAIELKSIICRFESCFPHKYYP